MTDNEEYGLTSKIIGGVVEERSKIVVAKIEISGAQVFNLQLGKQLSIIYQSLRTAETLCDLNIES